jgi:hypothetical protein
VSLANINQKSLSAERERTEQ